MGIIENPVIIMTRMQDDRVQCILGGPRDYVMEHYAICAADLISHIALAFHIDRKMVRAVVERELDDPTDNVSAMPDAEIENIKTLN